ncbi:DUF4190 domain-containing protein [Streptomyces sp. NPDC056479]|uniref:DUF4190 domain-containing protein n=1 Tax=Streptomyces sp. NPDC056479 TaxID=3345832 RepID=UPI0036B69DDB
MSDDAQTPEAPEGSGGGSWASPGSEAANPLEKKTSLDKPVGGAQARPSEPGGPGFTLASNEPPAAWPAPSVHDQQTMTSMPSSGGPPVEPQDAAPPSWVNPSPAPNASTANPFAAPGPTPSNPFAAPGSAPPNPFAPPTASVPYAAHGEPVPPPPIAPDGPGQVPYGYPGGHGYPPAQGYYGWPGMQAMPSNGMGTAGLVLGIISAVIFCLWPVAIIVGVLALIFGAIGRGKARRGEATNPGQALAGIICGAAGVVLGLVMLALVIATA